MGREIKNEYPSPPRGRARQRGGSSSSSPSPARNRREVPDRIEGLERGRSKQTESYERSRGSEDVEVRRKREEGSKVVRSRQGPVATMRLYSQSPSPPELSQWRQQRER